MSLTLKGAVFIWQVSKLIPFRWKIIDSDYWKFNYQWFASYPRKFQFGVLSRRHVEQKSIQLLFLKSLVKLSHNSLQIQHIHLRVGRKLPYWSVSPRPVATHTPASDTIRSPSQDQSRRPGPRCPLCAM